MHVVATAGHVDHGKSALVKALTGIDPDRLREEQVRQMTIDLGFAWATLPNGEAIGIIDVPGHEDFIENMLAGVGGIDAVVFVVAADEGLMPQSREHAEILGLLRVSAGVVALTKADLVTDQAWVELVQADVSSLLAEAGLPPFSQVAVSAVTGEGLEALTAQLAQALKNSPPRQDRNRPRLPVDRVFTMEGFGTVVTGTLTDGSLHVGEEIELGPSGLRARIRGLQSHKEKITLADPGRRVAVNLVGLEASAIQRGDVLMTPGGYTSTTRLDIRLRVLASEGSAVRHGEAVKVFHGTARRMGRLRLLESDRMDEGEQGWAQLELETPLVAEAHDLLVLRRPSPSRTVAGGEIADVSPAWRHRRSDQRVLASLSRLLSSSAVERLLEASERMGPVTAEQVVVAAGLEDGEAQASLSRLLEDGRLLAVSPQSPGGQLIAARSYIAARQDVCHVLAVYRERNPLRFGMPKEELRNKSGLEASTFAAVLQIAEREGVVEREGSRIRLFGDTPLPSAVEQAQLRQFEEAGAAAPYTPMSVKQARLMLGQDLFQYAVDSGRVILVSADVFFEAATYEDMVSRVLQRIGQNAGITVAEVRDLFGTTRKYALALMEHLDAIGFTVRDGDIRRRKDT